MYIIYAAKILSKYNSSKQKTNYTKAFPFSLFSKNLAQTKSKIVTQIISELLNIDLEKLETAIENLDPQLKVEEINCKRGQYKTAIVAIPGKDPLGTREYIYDNKLTNLQNSITSLFYKSEVTKATDNPTELLLDGLWRHLNNKNTPKDPISYFKLFRLLTNCYKSVISRELVNLVQFQSFFNSDGKAEQEKQMENKIFGQNFPNGDKVNFREIPSNDDVLNLPDLPEDQISLKDEASVAGGVMSGRTSRDSLNLNQMNISPRFSGFGQESLINLTKGSFGYRPKISSSRSFKNYSKNLKPKRRSSLRTILITHVLFRVTWVCCLF